MSFLLYPLLAAVVYAVGSLLLKRALVQGVGAWRMTFVCNGLLALLALPLFAVQAAPAGAGGRWYQPVVAGAAFFVGQLFTFLAINRGDVSVATPVLGTKVIFVALFTVFLVGVPIPWTLWLAALLTTAALVILGGGTRTAEAHRHFLSTALYAGVAALAFSLTDVVTQQWGPLWGTSAFAARFLSFCGVLSLGLIPFFHAPLGAIGRGTWPWLGSGAFLLGAQGILLYLVLGRYGHATAVNVVYNSRGLWTVLLVWSAGAWFANRERAAGPGAMARRLVGSLLLLAAIGLVLK